MHVARGLEHYHSNFLRLRTLFGDEMGPLEPKSMLVLSRLVCNTTRQRGEAPATHVSRCCICPASACFLWADSSGCIKSLAVSRLRWRWRFRYDEG
jgi:hypothetical protein